MTTTEITAETEILTGLTTRPITFSNSSVRVTLPAGTEVEFRPSAITRNGYVYAKVSGRRLSEVLPVALIAAP